MAYSVDRIGLESGVHNIRRSGNMEEQEYRGEQAIVILTIWPIKEYKSIILTNVDITLPAMVPKVDVTFPLRYWL